MNPRGKTALIVFCYLAVYIVWGSTYLFIKITVDTIHPFVLIALRFLFGGFLLLGIAGATGKLRRLPTLREILGSILLGTLLLLGGNGAVTVAEMERDSSFIALIVAAAPVFVAVFDRLIFRKKISLVKLAGVLVGFLGVILLFYDGSSFRDAFTVSVLIALGGVLSSSFGMSFRHRIAAPEASMVNTGIQMLFAGAVGLAVSMIWLPSIPDIMIHASVPSLLAFAFLAVVGTLVFVAFNYLLKEEPGLRVSSYALVNPVIASVLGIMLAGEKPVTFFFISLPLILLGIAFMLYGDRLVTTVKLRFGRKEE